MKKFFEKNWKTILVTILLVSFALLIMFTEEKETQNVVDYPSVASWQEDTSKDKPIVTVFALTTCGYCHDYELVINNLREQYEFDLYWYYLDELTDEDSAVLVATYPINFEGSVPYTFIVRNGEFIDDKLGGLEEATVLKFFKDNEVID